MMDIFMFCSDPKCICEDLCCQECEERTSCKDRCLNIRYKEAIYSSDEFLVAQLYELADKTDSWLIAVAAEKIRSLTNIT